MNRSSSLRAGLSFSAALFLAAAVSLTAAPAQAQLDDFFSDDEEDEGPFEVRGSLKTFSVMTYPYDHAVLGGDPALLGATVGRLILSFDGGEHIQAEVQPLIVATTAGLAGGSAGGLTTLGVGGARPEAIDLSINPVEGPLGNVTALIDRAFVRLKVPYVDVTLGRQPVSFGTGFFFTPMDLVSPFSPATLDREYKPGVDAVRGDVYIGQSGQITAVAAYATSWTLNGIVFAGHGRYTLLGIDLGIFGARAHRSWVFGLDGAGDILGIGLRSEVTGTLPDSDDERPFLRGVVGADIRWETIAISGELYVQTLGADDPKDYLKQFSSPRFGRGELYLVGQYYGAVSASWQFNPILTPGIAVIANIRDASVLISPSLSWSVSDEVSCALGAQIAQGARPDDITPDQLLGPDGAPLPPEAIVGLVRPRSEFGLYPITAFAQLSASF